MPRRSAHIGKAVAVAAVLLSALPVSASAAPGVSLSPAPCDASQVSVRFTGDGSAGKAAMIATNGTTTAVADIPASGTLVKTGQIVPHSRNTITVSVDGEQVLRRTIGVDCPNEAGVVPAYRSTADGPVAREGVELPFANAAGLIGAGSLALLAFAIGLALRNGSGTPGRDPGGRAASGRPARAERSLVLGRIRREAKRPAR